MRIKLKVKHLVLFVLLPASLLIFLFNFLPSQVKMDTDVAVESGFTRTELLQELDSTTGSKRMQLIQTNIIEKEHGYDPYRYNVTIGPSMSQWNQEEPNSLGLLPEDRVPLLEEYILDGPSDNTRIFAAKLLAYEYDATGRKTDGDQALITAATTLGSSSNVAKELTLLRAERALNQGDIATAEGILQQSDANAENQQDLAAQKAWLTGRLLFTKGKAQEALTVVSEGLASYKKFWQEIHDQMSLFTSSPDQNKGDSNVPASPEIGTSETEKQLEALQKAIQSAIVMESTSAATLSGTLTHNDGTPIARAGIFLRAEGEVNHSIRPTEPYRIVTDAEGRFELHGIIPGFYQLHLGLSYEQIDGWTWPVHYDDWIEVKSGDSLKEDVVLQPLIELQSPINQETITGSSVDFQWKAVKNASYYRLSGGTADGVVASTLIRDHIEENQVSIPVEELYASGGFSYGSTGDGFASIDPLSFLGFMNSEARMSWNVEAFDANGRLITRSNGYRLNENIASNLPFFYLKERELTPADQLLIDKKPDQALAMYQHNVAADPQDVHSLHMLVKLLLAKSSLTKDDSIEDQAMPLLKKLIQLRPNANYAFTLAKYYFDYADWKSYNEYDALYIKLSQNKGDAYDRSINAIALMRQDRLKEAREQLASALEQDASHRFVGSYLAAELYAGETLSSVMEMAERYPEHTFGHSGFRWPQMLKQLIAERNQQPTAFDQSLKEKLGWYVNGQTDVLKQWINGAKSSALKTFIQAVVEVS